MKLKKIIFFLTITCLLSCDRHVSDVVIGGNLQTKCGNVTVSCSSFNEDKLLITFNGDFLIKIDSLNIVKNQNNRSSKPRLGEIFLYTPSNTQYNEYEVKRLSDSISSLVVHDGERLSLNLKDEKTFWSLLVMGGKATILPSSFILCDGVPVIKDTISIYSKGMWKMKKAKPRGKGNQKKSQD